MRIKVLYLTGFSHRLHGGRAARAAERLACHRFDGFAKLVGRFISKSMFEGLAQRLRVFTPWVTFCVFLGQVMQRDCACREVVRRLQGGRLAQGKAAPSASTSAYCQARGRLGMATLRRAHEALIAKLDAWSAGQERWCGRPVKLIDGTGFSMPDTGENRHVYPYAGGQKEGCGFPVGKLVGVFSLAGHLVRFAHDSWKTHEIGLCRRLVGWMQAGDVVVADRGFCGWGVIALLQRKHVDVVMRLHQCRTDRPGRSVWKRPELPETWGRALWAELPRELTVRIISLRVAVPGFRTESVTLATTLLDEQAYPDEALIELYRLRWQVEGNYRDIKTTLGLDVLRTLTPAMIEREVLMQAIAHNLVRAVMLDAARNRDVPLTRLSFKGSLCALRQWAPVLLAANGTVRDQLYEDLLGVIASDLLPLRPNRCEPRAVKRRPKIYQLMTKPRHFMRVSKSRRQ